MHTPRGVYELRFFFHSGITSSMGEAISSVTIKDKIRKMIEGEDTARPLSDSRIAELLGADGLPLARRTVAKYRESCASLRRTCASRSTRRRGPLRSGRAGEPWPHEVEYTGRQTDVPARLRAFAERKLKKLEKLVGRPLHAHVILTVDRHRQIAEVSVHSPRHDMTATEDRRTWGLAGTVMDKLDPPGAAPRGKRQSQKKKAGAGAHVVRGRRCRAGEGPAPDARPQGERPSVKVRSSSPRGGGWS
jgi:ribosome-associated translation inhibitor RaiA